MVIVRIQPALALREKNDSEITQYTTDRASDLTLHSVSFPGLKPTPAQLTEKNKAFILALAAMSESSKSKTIAKNKTRRELEIMLLNCAASCAEISDGNLEIYTRSNFAYKNNPSLPPDSLPAAENLTLQLGPGEGQLYVNFKTEELAHCYQIWYGRMDIKPEEWTDFMTTTSGKKNLLNELQSSVVYGVRVKTIGSKKVKGQWTNVHSKKTY
ncbi:MAG: hypothetical protein ABIT08_14230 [Bacteroidia bacterium]